METKTVAIVNKISILMIEDGEKLIPIRPICQALGIDEKGQRTKIKEDEILGSTGVLSTSVGMDGKEREMFCIPFKYVFGWLFTINPKNVKPEAKEAVTKYRMQCYDVLFKHFTDQSEFLEQKQVAINEQIQEVERIRHDFKNTKQKLDEARKLLYVVKDLTFEGWKENNRQLKIEFPTNQEAT
jgi:hypothetical protein